MTATLLRSRALALSLGATLLALSAAGCAEKEKPYEPKPAASGKKPALPAVPNLPQRAKKNGDVYNIYGVTHDLRSRVHRETVDGKSITIEGYIVKTNYADAPECAVHKPGKEDPATCEAPIPAFWIADDKNETKDMIQVVNWASNFAAIWGMLDELEKAPKGKEKEAKYTDTFLAKELPNPLPQKGAKVKITGMYGATFNATRGVVSNPKYGVLAIEKLEYLEPPTEQVELKGRKSDKKK